MPLAMERALKRVAARKGYKGERKDAFVYGSMRNAGWKPKRERDTEHAVKALRSR
jgi:hypothetical protein